jgi:GNAT superfamily N-acetyltransferase
VLYCAAPTEPLAVSLPVRMGDDIPYAESVGDIAGKDGVTLFSAVAGDDDEQWEDQAFGALFVDGVAAYLGPAGTRDAYRRRGGQTALIAARLNRAAEVGCEHAFAETYKRILATSYNNLLRGGFTHTYSCPIYVWELD